MPPVVGHTKKPSSRARPFRAVMLLLVCGGAATASYYTWEAVREREAREQALRAVQTRGFDAAEPLLKDVLDRHPDDAAIVRALALGTLAKGRFSDAEHYLSLWCDLQPARAEPLLRRLELWTTLQRVSEAIEDARNVLELEPDNFEIRHQRMLRLIEAGRYDEAEQECLLCERKLPDDPYLLYTRANINYRRGDSAKAETLLDRVLHDASLREHDRDGRTTALALGLRAILYNDAGQPAKAVPLLRQVLSANPKNQLARYHLSLALDRLGQQDEARKLMAEHQAQDALNLWAQRGHEPNPGLLVRAAEGLFGVGKADDAVSLLEKALKQDPACSAAHRLLADHYEKQGQPTKAAEHRRRVEK